MTKEERTLKKVFVTHQQIQDICKRMGAEITKDYQDKNKPVLMVGLLKGCHPFMSDLLKHVDILMEIDYMDVSSFFGGTKSSGEVQIIKDLQTQVDGRDVLLIEDVVDSGRTIKKVIDLLKFRGAKSVEIATLIDKPAGRSVDLSACYIGETLPDEFLLGYGLDYKEMYRDLNCIGVPFDHLIEEDDE